MTTNDDGNRAALGCLGAFLIAAALVGLYLLFGGTP